jgi:hypothetical protein
VPNLRFRRGRDRGAHRPLGGNEEYVEDCLVCASLTSSTSRLVSIGACRYGPNWIGCYRLTPGSASTPLTEAPGKDQLARIATIISLRQATSAIHRSQKSIPYCGLPCLDPSFSSPIEIAGRWGGCGITVWFARYRGFGTTRCSFSAFWIASRIPIVLPVNSFSSRLSINPPDFGFGRFR